MTPFRRPARALAGLASLGMLLGATSVRAEVGAVRGGIAGGAGISTRAKAFPTARVFGSYEPFDAWEVGLGVGYARVPSSLDAAPGTTHFLSIAPELSYHFDVVRWIPYVGAAAGYYRSFGKQDAGGAVLAPVVGIDYLWLRELRVGLSYRPEWYVPTLGVPLHQLLLRVQLGSAW